MSAPTIGEHGFTLGELAQMFERSEENLRAHLQAAGMSLGGDDQRYTLEEAVQLEMLLRRSALSDCLLTRPHEAGAQQLPLTDKCEDMHEKQGTYHRGERYVIPALSLKRKSWSQSDNAALVKLIETGVADPAEFCERLAEMTGVYRFPSGLSLRLEFVRQYVKHPHELRKALGRLGNELSRAAKQYRLDEAEKLRCGGIDELPEWISVQAATQLLGGIDHRLTGIEVRQDKLTALRVIRKKLVLERRQELKENGTLNAKRAKPRNTGKPAKMSAAPTSAPLVSEPPPIPPKSNTAANHKNGDLRTEILRAIREQEVTPQQGMEMLQSLYQAKGA